MKNTVITLLALLASAGNLAVTPWQKVSQSIGGDAQSIGAFSNGCIVGTETLPLSVTGYQVMRTDQHRYFGRPDLVRFIQCLGNQVHNKGMGIVLVDDMGTSTGGHFNGGHASHQMGLDVGILPQLPQTHWTSSQLLRPQVLDLVASSGKHVVSSLQNPQISQLIKLAAEDSEVIRIFVSLAIKQQLYLDMSSDRQWLRGVHPWFQHRARMHVRLRCPAENLEHKDRAPPPPGDDCGMELQNWSELPEPGSTPPTKKTPPPLPSPCQALLDEHVL